MLVMKLYCQLVCSSFFGCRQPVTTAITIPYIQLRCGYFRNSKEQFSSYAGLLKPITMRIPENTMMVARTSLKPINSKNRTESEQDKLDHISLLFMYKSRGEEKLIRLVRPSNDVFSNTLRRLKGKLIQDTLKTMLLDASEDVKLGNYNASEFIERTNEEVLYNSEISSLELNGVNFRLIRDAPECNMLKIGLNPMVGCPLIASYDLCPGRQPLSTLNFHWYVGSKSPDADCAKSNSEDFCGDDENYWEYRHTGLWFKPEMRDVGKYVSVTIDLGVDTASRSAVSKLPVTEVPEEPLIFSRRQECYCSENYHDGLRILSYNILADLYLNLRLPQDQLFFPYCPKQFQEYTYRYSLELKELLGYNADLIFLQEVDERFRRRFLIPYMEGHGFKVYFKKKGLVVSEGLAICIRDTKLRKMESFDAWLPDLLNPDLFPENLDIISLLNLKPLLKQHFVTRPAVIQLMSLEVESNEKAIVLVGNTHLHFHPKQEDIKILQALLCTRYIANVAKRLNMEFPNAKVYKLFAGDFNSTPDCGVYQLISEGSIPGNHEIWNSSNNNSQDVMSVLGATVSSYLNPMKSLAGDPPYTNYTLHMEDEANFGFSGCLDYIWGDPSVKVNRVIPMPDDELVRKHTALPSTIGPSDHLPLICDVQL